MDEFTAILLAYPTVVWTVLVGVCLVFWGFVIVGAADFDSVGGKAEGAVKGALEGAAKGGVEALKGGVESMKGSVEALKGGADVDVDAEPSTIAELLGFLKLDRAPITITASFFSLFGWLLSFVATYLVGGGALVGTGVMAGSAIASLLLTSLAIRPFGVIFDEATRHGGDAMIGKSCVVRSGKVDQKSGQAEIHERGASLIVDVRVADGAPPLKKDDEAVVVEYDAAHDCYVVAPLEPPTDVDAARAGMISRPVDALADVAAPRTVDHEKEQA